MSGNNKHGPNKISNYFDTHETIMQQFVSRGFVVSNELEIAPYGNSYITMFGNVRCLGGIVLEVRKILQVVDEQAGEARVQNVWYTYHARVQGIGNIVRYDSPHEHRPIHHLHKYETFADHDDAEIVEIEEGQWPTIGDVLNELEAWYYEHIENLPDAIAD